jgi:DNA gyrase/topoisomerase IV subunit A
MLEKVKSRGLDYNLQQLSERERAKQEQQALDEKMESLSRQYNSQLELWQRMRDKIVDVHDSLDLIRPDDLLATDGVSESNVLAYLAEIEKVRRYNTYSYASTLIHHAE